MEQDAGYNTGAQLERTFFAWNRSALAAAANGVLVLREAFLRDTVPLVAGGLTIVGIAVAAGMLSGLFYRSAVEDDASHLTAGRERMVAGAALFSFLLSAADLVLVLA